MSAYMPPGWQIGLCDLKPKGFKESGTLTHLLPLTQYQLNNGESMNLITIDPETGYSVDATCGTCKHWDCIEEGKTGICDGRPSYFVEDPYVAFITPADFSCALWEPKE